MTTTVEELERQLRDLRSLVAQMIVVMANLRGVELQLVLALLQPDDERRGARAKLALEAFDKSGGEFDVLLKEYESIWTSHP